MIGPYCGECGGRLRSGRPSILGVRILVLRKVEQEKGVNLLESAAR